MGVNVGVMQTSFNLKSTGLFSPGTALGGGLFSTPLCKIRSRHPRKLELTGLIAYIMFDKICKFESSTITNDVIMTSLQKQWQNFVSYTNPHKIRSRQPKDLKLGGVIVYTEFHKI